MNIVVIVIILIFSLVAPEQVNIAGNKITQQELLLSLLILDYSPQTGPQLCPAINIVLY